MMMNLLFIFFNLSEYVMRVARSAGIFRYPLPLM